MGRLKVCKKCGLKNRGDAGLNIHIDKLGHLVKCTAGEAHYVNWRNAGKE